MQKQENFTGMCYSRKGFLERRQKQGREDRGPALQRLGEQTMVDRPAQKLVQKLRCDQHVTFKSQLHYSLWFDLR